MKKLLAFMLLVMVVFYSTKVIYATETIQSRKNTQTEYSIQKMFTNKELVQTELIIKLLGEFTPQEQVKFMKQFNVSRMERISHSFYILSFSPDVNLVKKAETISRHNKVGLVEPNYKINREFIPKDPLYKKQWHHTKVNSPKAWDTTKGTSSTIVAVIDDGVKTNHPDLSGKIYKPYDALDNNTSYFAGEHATHVAGIIAASMNKVGGAGMAPNVKIMPINVFYGDSATSEDIATGIIYAADNGADVINLSLGSYHYSYLTEYAVNYALSKGAVLVAAAGNDDTYNPTYPASYTGVFGISATNPSDYVTGFSNYGSYIDFAAPGEDIYSSVLNGYDYMSGTSMAAPVVSGTIALMLSKNPLLSNADVHATLRKSTKDLYGKGWDAYSGYGRIDASRAVVNTPEALSKITLSSTNYKMNGTNSVSTTFKAHSQSYVTAYVKDSKGKVIRTLTKNKKSTGTHIKLYWNGKTDSGVYVGSGNYKIVIQAAKPSNSNRVAKESSVTVTNNVPPSISLEKGTVYFSSKISKSIPIKFTTNKSARITAKVYDKKGAVVQTLLNNKSYGVGTYTTSWNGKSNKGKVMADGDYKIRFDIIDSSKRKGSSKTVVVKVDTKAPVIKSYAISPTIFKVGKDKGTNGKVTLGEATVLNIHVVNEKNQKVKTIKQNNSYKTGTYTLSWDGKSDKKEIVPEGKYKFVFEGKDTAGNKSTVNSGWVNVQNWTAPSITAPATLNYDDENQPFTANYSVNKPGKVTVEIQQGSNIVRQIATNLTINAGSQSFMWDGKDKVGNVVTDGDYQYTITLIDKFNQKKTTTGMIKVNFTKVEITVPSFVRYNPHDYESVGEVFYKLSNDAYVTVEIMDGNNEKVRTIVSHSHRLKGIQHFVWDGRDDNEDIAKYYYEEPFKYKITAEGNNKIKTVAGGTFDEEADPSWLNSTSYSLEEAFNSYYYEKLELQTNTSEEAKLYLDIYGSYYDEYTLDTMNYDLKKGNNSLVYVKNPDILSKGYIVYLITLEDLLGNRYGYIIDEYDYELSGTSMVTKKNKWKPINK
ncbi:S8 family serine peptidase [Fictibacillus phosphorivorans]|uniref:S8 family serine peptidase n=1 Tax=Fictibacillus phosphorivorans TaxID=1221500 RepID=UPI003CFAC264